MWPCRPTKLYCSPQCQRASRTEDERQARREANARKRCAWCDGPMPANARAFARFCCSTCKDRDRWQRRREAHNAKRRARYATDPERRETLKARARETYYRRKG